MQRNGTAVHLCITADINNTFHAYLAVPVHLS